MRYITMQKQFSKMGGITNQRHLSGRSRSRGKLLWISFWTQNFGWDPPSLYKATSPSVDDQSLKKAPPVTARPVVPMLVRVAVLPCGGSSVFSDCHSPFLSFSISISWVKRQPGLLFQLSFNNQWFIILKLAGSSGVLSFLLSFSCSIFLEPGWA